MTKAQRLRRAEKNLGIAILKLNIAEDELSKSGFGGSASDIKEMINFVAEILHDTIETAIELEEK